EREADAERLPLHGVGRGRPAARSAAADSLDGRYREFAAGEKACRLARKRDERRLCERGHRALALERIELDVEGASECAEGLRNDAEAVSDRAYRKDGSADTRSRQKRSRSHTRAAAERVAR